MTTLVSGTPAMPKRRSIRRVGAHGHKVLGDWDTERSIRCVYIRRGLWVEKLEESRGCFGREGGPACCVDYRTRIRVVGNIVTQRDALAVSKAITQFATVEAP